MIIWGQRKAQAAEGSRTHSFVPQSTCCSINRDCQFIINNKLISNNCKSECVKLMMMTKKKHSLCRSTGKSLRGGLRQIPACSMKTCCVHMYPRMWSCMVCARVTVFARVLEVVKFLEVSPFKGGPRHLLTELRAFTAS